MSWPAREAGSARRAVNAGGSHTRILRTAKWSSLCLESPPWQQKDEEITPALSDMS